MIPVLFSGFANGAKQFHFFFYSSLDSFCAGSQKLTRVKALAFQILTSFDVLAGSISKCQLALGVNVDLGYAKVNCFLDLICRDSGTTVQNQRKLTGQLLYSCQSFKA